MPYTYNIELKPSLSLKILFSSLYGGAILILLLLPLPWWSKIILITMCCLSAVLKNKNPIVKLQKTANKWLLQQRDGVTLEATLGGSGFISPKLLILNFKCIEKNKIRSVLIANDSCANPTTLRQFRAALLISIPQ